MRRPGGPPPRPRYVAAAVREHTESLPWRCAFTLPTEPGSVRVARQTAAIRLVESGIAARSALADAALLVISELVANAVRHTAGESPNVLVTVAVAADKLSIAVGDRDRRMVDVTGGSVTGGLAAVRELAAGFGGGVRVEPATWGHGKAVVVWFPRADSR